MKEEALTSIPSQRERKNCRNPLRFSVHSEAKYNKSIDAFR